MISSDKACSFGMKKGYFDLHRKSEKLIALPLFILGKRRRFKNGKKRSEKKHTKVYKDRCYMGTLFQNFQETISFGGALSRQDHNVIRHV